MYSSSDWAKECEALEAEVEKLKLEIEQCHAKSTCCCGDYMKQHTGHDGHSPVSLYDHTLHRTQQRVAELELIVEGEGS